MPVYQNEIGRFHILNEYAIQGGQFKVILSLECTNILTIYCSNRFEVTPTDTYNYEWVRYCVIDVHGKVFY